MSKDDGRKYLIFPSQLANAISRFVQELRNITRELEKRYDGLEEEGDGDEGEAGDMEGEGDRHYQYNRYNNDPGRDHPESYNSPEKVRPAYRKGGGISSSSRSLLGSPSSPSSGHRRRRSSEFTTPTKKTPLRGGGSSDDLNLSTSSAGSDTLITLTPGRCLEDQIGHLVGKFGGTPSPPMQNRSRQQENE